MRRKKKRVGLVAKVLIAAFAVYAACTLVNLQFRINAAAAEQEAIVYVAERCACGKEEEDFPI